MPLVYHCTQFNAATQQCEAGAWVEQSQGLLPPLSVEDAGLLGASIVTFWAICAVLRILRQELAKL